MWYITYNATDGARVYVLVGAASREEAIRLVKERAKNGFHSLAHAEDYAGLVVLQGSNRG